MEQVIQKSVELGVTEIIPVAMKNCVVKLDEKRAQAKQARWQAIAQSAAKQSKRSIIPTVGEVMRFADAVAYAGKLDVRILPYENQRGLARTGGGVRFFGDCAGERRYGDGFSRKPYPSYGDCRDLRAFHAVV